MTSSSLSFKILVLFCVYTLCSGGNVMSGAAGSDATIGEDFVRDSNPSDEGSLSGDSGIGSRRDSFDGDSVNSRRNSWANSGNRGSFDAGGRGRTRNQKPAPLPIDPELMSLSEDLYRLDQQNGAARESVDWTIDTRSTNGRLFTRLNKNVFKKKTYADMIALFDNYIAELGQSEDNTPQERQEQITFLNDVLDTAVMKKAWDFLVKRRLASSDRTQFRNYLQTIWFTVYKRRGRPDTSGFEHLLGELDGSGPSSPVIGLHSWVQYALEEDAGRIRFQKWKGQTDPDIVGVQFSWNGHQKIKSTIAFGESPEMTMAVFTVCFLVAPDNECKLRMGGAPVSVQTYKWTSNTNSDLYVASSYYDS